MPRPQRPLDPSDGPVAAFATELRALRARAGDPKFATMARRSGRSKTALSEAVGGRHLPRWETVVGFVEACSEDPETWRARWDGVRATSSGTTDGPDGGAVTGTGAIDTGATDSGEGDGPGTDEAPPPPDHRPRDVPPSRRPGRGRLAAALVGAAVVGAAVTLAAVALLGSAGPPPAPSVPVIVVQNKVAVGPTSCSRTPPRPISRSSRRRTARPGAAPCPAPTWPAAPCSPSTAPWAPWT